MRRWRSSHGEKHRRPDHASVRESEAADPRIIINASLPPEEQARQIRELFRQLGLGYSCLILYLSSRIDLLPVEFCREFALTPDNSPAIPVDEVQHTLEQELGASLNSTLAEFNPVPIRSTLLTHAHTARLASGVPVVMNFLRPECSMLGKEPELPRSFDKALVRECFNGKVSDEVLLDFFSGLRRKCNFTGQREILELMVQDHRCEVLCNPRIYHELCTSRIFTSEQVEGTPIHELPHQHACNTDTLARNLCQAWLYQVLMGAGFAVDPQPQGIAVAENTLLFTDCDFITLPSSTKENLWNYLMATMVDDPDKAALYLLREMWRQRVKVDAETFRSKFRQSAYFGALEPLLGTNSNALAQLIFQHWKTALEYGYTPKPHLLCFYRGLFSIARTAHRLSPLGDPLREGMEEMRSNWIMGQVKEIADWDYWFQHSDKFATAMVNMPKMLDDALTRAAAPNPDSQGRESGRIDKRTGGTSDMTIILALAAVVLMSQSSSVSPTMERLLLLLVFLAGLMTLKKSAD